MKIGIVDLDNTHPEHWIPIERELGHEVVCVWDGGSVHPPEYVTAFAERFKIPDVCSRLDEMVGKIDCAVIHGCDWDTHLEKVRPFAEAGRSVLLDKPLAGRISDLRQLREWVERGVRISGGSSLAYCREIREWCSRPVDERGVPQTVISLCGVDEFNYAVHGYSAIAGILGGDAVSVRQVGSGDQRRVVIDYGDGRLGIVIIGTADTPMTFDVSISTDRGQEQFHVDTTQLYRDYLVAMLPYLSGDTDDPPASLQDWLAPETWALAAKTSWLNDNCEVSLQEPKQITATYDGREFANYYRAKRAEG